MLVEMPRNWIVSENTTRFHQLSGLQPTQTNQVTLVLLLTYYFIKPRCKMHTFFPSYIFLFQSCSIRLGTLQAFSGFFTGLMPCCSVPLSTSGVIVLKKDDVVAVEIGCTRMLRGADYNFRQRFLLTVTGVCMTWLMIRWQWQFCID